MECGVRSTHQHIVLDGVFTWKCITWHWYKYKSDAALGYRDYNFRFDWKQCCWSLRIFNIPTDCAVCVCVCSSHPMNMLASKEGSRYSNIILLAYAASALICCLKLQLRPFHWCHSFTKWFVVHAKPLLFAMLTTYCSIITDRTKKQQTIIIGFYLLKGYLNYSLVLFTYVFVCVRLLLVAPQIIHSTRW